MAENTSDALGPDPVVGFEDEAMKIMERLIGKPKRLDVISIVGMPGLGKTTIALKVYNDPCIAHQFYIRAFISVSQVYNKRDLLLGILSSSHINTSTTQRDLNKMSDEELKEELYKRLKGKRYLIVFDDIWNIEAWDDLKRSFPDDNNGSRIMFTSRIRDVALRANSIPHDLRFLSRDESWDLFHEKVFHKEICPPELMEVGKNIAENCRGLPLAIVIVGGLLAKTEKTIHWWTQVGKSIASYLVSDSNQTTKSTLELSYNHLPAHLKPLFLYFGAFPEDYEIPVSKLIWLWIAEGFIDIAKSGTESTVEDVAEGYLMDLVERSLILIANRNSIGGVKSCRIHDLLHDLCLRKAEAENFMLIIHRYKHFSSIISPPSSSSPIGNKLYRLSTTSYDSFLDFFPYAQYRNIYSLLVFDKTRLLSDFDFQFFKLIRVLDFGRDFSYHLPSGIGQLVHLRYLALKSVSFALSKFVLRNLETLIIEDEAATSVNNDIFQMTKLRHFHIGAFEPVNWDYSNLLVELQTMSTPTFTGTNCAMLRTTPNLRKLRCLCAVSCRELELLVKLEKLHMRRDVGLLNPSKPFDLFDLPTSLKQITLSEFRFDWKDISKLARLPNLEVLKLVDKAFKGKLWDTNLLESNFQPFPKLKLLKFKSLDIVQWNASMDHFPSLQRLVVKMCFKLKEIPSDIGDIVTLEKIEVNWSSHTLAYSVRKILEEQRDKGNEQLEIFIYPPDL